MLQQPLARRVAGAARYAAAGEALPGALPLSSMRRRARGLRAAPFQPMERQMPQRARPGAGPGRREIERYLSVGRLRLYRSFSETPPPILTRTF